MMDSPERDPVLLFKDSLYVIRPLIHQVFWIDQSCSRYGVATGIKNWYASVLFGAQLSKDVKNSSFFFLSVFCLCWVLYRQWHKWGRSWGGWLGFERNGRLLQGMTLKLRHMYYRPKTSYEYQVGRNANAAPWDVSISLGSSLMGGERGSIWCRDHTRARPCRPWSETWITFQVGWEAVKSIPRK